MLEGGYYARSLALVLFVQYQFDGIAFASEKRLKIHLLQVFAGTVRGEIVDDDEFFAEMSDGLPHDRLQKLHNRLAFVKDGNNDGEGRKDRKARLCRGCGDPRCIVRGVHFSSQKSSPTGNSGLIPRRKPLCTDGQ